MKRSPIVAVGTVVGLASVLSFHTTPVKIHLSLATDTTTTQPVATTTQRKLPATSTSTVTPTTTTLAPTTTTSSAQARSTTSTAPTTTMAPVSTTVAPTTSTTVAPTTTTVAPTTTTTVAAAGVQSVTGPQVNYYYGVLSVKVTANGRKITGVTIASINDGGNPLSQQIDQYSVPILAQEALSAQSGTIQSVSGASYTSAGFQLSLQNALKKLGLS